ncbi:MAG TPA: hypothetical protein PKK26_13605, partial [Candidatus Wallbacteria bacterium]|nr:hypothetical protein [Candidatus Wallbacteria bacterium]
MKNRFTYYLLSFFIMLTAASSISCSSGGSAIDKVFDGSSGRKVPLGINFSFANAAGGAETISPTASGSVEIRIFRNPTAESIESGALTRQTLLGRYDCDYQQRKADIEVFAGETYSVYLTARIKNGASDTTETVYESEADIFVSNTSNQEVFTPNEPQTPITMPLKYSHDEKLYISRISFSGEMPQILVSNQAVPPFPVNLLDQNGNIFSGFNGTVELSLSGVKNALSGKTTVNATCGIAQFTDISLKLPSDKYESIQFTARAQKAYGYSGRVYLMKQGAVPVVAGLEFVNYTPPMSSVNSPWPQFTVKLLDKNGLLVDTSETVTLSASEGALTGVTTVNASHGIAVFKNIAATAPGKITVTLKSGAAEIKSPEIFVASGQLKSSLVFLFSSNFLLCFDFAYSDGGTKIEKSLALKWYAPIYDIEKIKLSPFKDKLYALDRYNTFYEISNIQTADLPDILSTDLDEIVLPRDTLSGEGGIVSMGRLRSFVPSSDDLSVFLCSDTEVYKWHRMNKPWLISSIARSRDGNRINDIIEYKNNKIAATTEGSIKLFDFSQLPPVEKTSATVGGWPDSLEMDGYGDRVIACESSGQFIYKIETGDNSAEKIALGPEGSAESYSFLKYNNYGGTEKVFMERYPDGNIYSYDL